jgi:hypothetical protein
MFEACSTLREDTPYEPRKQNRRRFENSFRDGLAVQAKPGKLHTFEGAPGKEDRTADAGARARFREISPR